MKNMKKAMKKGFTLIELVIVMAIFSILLVFVMSLTGPVSRIFQNTSLSEKTYSYANNIQVFLQGKLEYTDNLYVYTADQLEEFAHSWLGDGGGANGVVDDDELYAIAESFRAGPGFHDGHYKDVVVNYTGDEDDTQYASGNIYIMRLVNNANRPMDASRNIIPGQITLSTYHFVTNEAIPTGVVDEVPQLNRAYFGADDAERHGDAIYRFSYALGASSLVTVPNPPGSDAGDSYRALNNDFDNSGFTGTGLSNMSLSIVIDKDASQDGFVDVDGGGYTYRAFKNPSVLQIANLPLTNINMRTRMSRGSYGVQRPFMDGGRIEIQTPDQAGDGFRINTSGNVDFNQDIYFVFAYADELR